VVLSAIVLALCVFSTPSKAEPQAGRLPNPKDAPAQSDSSSVKQDSPANTTPANKAGRAKNGPFAAKEVAKQAPLLKLELSIDDPRAFQGYTLFCPMDSSKTYLIDMQGKVVHTWESECSPASRCGLVSPDLRAVS
jgi:hypothetical protein